MRPFTTGLPAVLYTLHSAQPTQETPWMCHMWALTLTTLLFGLFVAKSYQLPASLDFKWKNQCLEHGRGLQKLQLQLLSHSQVLHGRTACGLDQRPGRHFLCYVQTQRQDGFENTGICYHVQPRAIIFSLNFCLKSSGHFGLVCREREGRKLWACCESVRGGTCKAGKMTS